MNRIQQHAAVAASDATAAAASSAEDDDRRAVESVLAGDPGAFRALVRRHQQPIFALAMMMTRERPAAEEVAQDAFLNAFRHLDRYDRQRPFYPWLATIATRLAQTWLRRHGAHLALAAPGTNADGTALIVDTQPSPTEVAMAEEQQRTLWGHVAALSSGERTAVQLHYRQQCSVDEVARQMGVAPGTIKTLLFRARRKLRERLTRATHPPHVPASTTESSR